jgi:ketosteroid isomerase-like protein
MSLQEVSMSDAETVVRSFYAAMARSDVASALALLDPKVRWSEAEGSPYFRGELEGAAAILSSVFDPIRQDFEDFAGTPLDYLTQGDRTAAFGRYAGRSRDTGRELDAAFVHLWTVRAGLILRFQQYTNTAAWVQARA